jgi:hypothetical protein
VRRTASSVGETESVEEGKDGSRLKKRGKKLMDKKTARAKRILKKGKSPLTLSKKGS